MCVETSSSCLCRKYRIPGIDLHFDIVQRFYFIVDVRFTRLPEEKERNTLPVKDKTIKEFNCIGNITFLTDSIFD